MANAPIHKVRYGSVDVAVWEREIASQRGSFKAQSFTIQKAYKDKDGKIQNTTSFRLTDIPLIIEALKKVLDWKYFNVGSKSTKSKTSTVKPAPEEEPDNTPDDIPF